MRIAWCDTKKVEDVKPLLPPNYWILGSSTKDNVLIAGRDNAGWTLDGYVIPRLGSALVYCEEMTDGYYHQT
jgi:hypothetical protein